MKTRLNHFLMILACAYLLESKLYGQTQLILSVNVDDVAVFIDGKLVGNANQTGMVKDVSPGRHKVTVTKANFKTVSKDVFLRTGDKVPLNFELERTKGKLNIAVTLDGKDVPAIVATKFSVIGKSPIEGLSMLTGLYQISIAYNEIIRDMKIQIEEGKLTTMSIEMGQKVRIIASLNSTQVQADISIDGVNVGITPVTKWLTPGTHEIKLIKDTITMSKSIIVENLEGREMIKEIELLSFSQLSFLKSSSLNIFSSMYGKEFQLPFNVKVSKGKHLFSFYSPSNSNLIPLDTSLFVDGTSSYKVTIALSSTLPYAQPGEVGRKIKTMASAEQFQKPEYKVKYSKWPKWRNAAINFAAFLALTSHLGSQTKVDSDGNVIPKYETLTLLSAFGGLILGTICVPLLTPEKEKRISIKENIQYNRTVVPQLLYERNKEIETYNKETSRLLEIIQKKKYKEQAIQIERTPVN